MRENQGNARGSCCSQGRHRALSALISLSLAGALGVTTVGCSGESTLDVTAEEASEGAGSNDATEDELIEAHLQARGHDTSSVRFEGDTVIVEDDMVMSRALLLEEAEAEVTGVVEKGYFHTAGTLFSGKRIQLSFGSTVSAAWRTAFNTARGEWNNKTPMFSRDPGSAATISVVMGSLATNVFANGTFPSGRTITINSNYSGACASDIESLPANVKLYNALHEIGHVLGFTHPPPNTSSVARTHIAGTEANNGGLIEPTYATVMATGCNTRTTLSPDDVKSAGKKYPSCIATCEKNCESLLDPNMIGQCMAACPQQCGG